MTANACSTINRLKAIIVVRHENELKSFLSAEKGFRSEQYNIGLSILHYVAGREFETAEEADEWVSYALVQKEQDIEMESRYGGLRPLHCACEWGNIFGVEYLVSHGANVDRKDAGGPTPYSYALRSSVDTMKKLLYLEEHGYVLMPTDILGAAYNKFSSSEKADEIFHYLVNEKGLSVNAIDEDCATPLHYACKDGSIFGVKWLVEHNADINNSDMFEDITPFLLACGSSIDRSLKAHYLCEKGADCGASDWDGESALFYAVRQSQCKDDMKDFLQYLVIEKGNDINSVNENGMTPLLYACYFHPSFVVIQQLIELGADLSVSSKMGNALHMAAQNRHTTKSIIDLLIENGADGTCLDKDGKTPHEVARDGEIKALLRQNYDAVRFSVLQQEMPFVASANPFETSSTCMAANPKKSLCVRVKKHERSEAKAPKKF
ncbi:serine/threonine-protein phosphatase 6 regulatory ankyrin repeat subunit B-like [Oscarella lobularis]|uniref:serine/threonine-protein phosphatase 6 regulatory ankyrin repeat subunit B-like n=1 Tax=Oscarella lobularis TaxID=121494 RepID=UPI003313BF59